MQLQQRMRASAHATSKTSRRPLLCRAQAAATTPKVSVDWDNLGFGLQDVAQTMYVAEWTAEKGWDQGTLKPYGPLQMMPSAQVLNYGQSVFEGMKAQRSAAGNIVLFRCGARKPGVRVWRP
eukprot:GHRQ01033784.1.p2 GENE.GHRQ01033784.1~~GHRQ01033784.1.p2  ORF type:complete len:122 (+),score=25.22 GHRQ01033784.1:67-432(+)